jgi:hypothetical protein
MTLREYNRQWRADNPEKCAAYTKKYRVKDPEKHAAKRQEWIDANPEHVLEYHRGWRAANPEKVNAASKKWREANPEKQKAACQNWRDNNREHIREHDKQRCVTDISYRLSERLRGRLRGAMRSQATRKTNSAMSLVGCDMQLLRFYLESLFKKGMDWLNYGSVWEIDHRIPCASYDLSLAENQRACFHYTNLQPLFVAENRRKGDKMPVT